MIEAMIAFSDAPADSDAAWHELRQQMVDRQIVARGVKAEAVLDAIRAVPRHLFVPEAHRRSAYEDMALPIGEGQTISQPYMVALMTQALGVNAPGRVLEIGTGSGYQCAVLAEMGVEVFTIERIAHLASRVEARICSLEYGDRVHFRVGDGSVGWPEEAPFDAIVVTAGAPSIPPALRDQLAVGGRLVIPVGKHGYQDLLQLTRAESEKFDERRLCGCTFVPLLGEEGWPVG